MNKLIIPGIILLLQIAAYIFMYFDSKNGHADIPIAWIVFNLIAFFNSIVLILSYFFYFNAQDKLKFWLVPITIAVLTIVVLIIQYIRMFMGKF